MAVLTSSPPSSMADPSAPKPNPQVNFLLGQCLKIMPTADPKLMRKILEEKLERLWST